MDSDESLEQGKKSNLTSRCLAYLRTKIDTDQHLLEFELLLLALATGIIDAVSFPKFHCCKSGKRHVPSTMLKSTRPAVVSNQTGNTVLFAVSAFSLFGTRQQTDFTVPAAHLGVSLGFFCLGVFTAGQIANKLACKEARWWLLLTNFVQTTMFLIAALLNLVFRTGNQPAEARLVNSASILCSIGLLAMASGMQVAMSRQLSMPEIPTTQATAAYVDLFVDPNFFAGVCQNRSRNRRVAFLATLCVGSFIGAPAYHYVSTALALFLAGMVKVVVLVLFFVNKGKVEKRIHDSKIEKV